MMQVGRRALLGAAAAAPILGAGRRARAAAEPLRLGAVLSVTGANSFNGDPEDKTLRQYVEMINGQGGVDGRRIELTIYDDSADAAKTNTFTRRLIQQDKVSVILGPSLTGPTLGIIPLVEASHVPTLSYGGGSAIIDPVRPYVFKVVQTDRLGALKIMGELKERGIKTIGLMADTGGYGKTARPVMMGVAKENGIAIGADETFGYNDTDMTPQLTHARQAGVEALVILSSTEVPATIARNCHQLGMTIPLYVTAGQATFEFVKAAGAVGNGIRLPTSAVLVADQLPESKPERKPALAYIKAFEDRWKMKASTFGGFAYDSLMLALDAVKRTGSTDPVKLRDAIEQTKDFVGVTGIFNMSPTDHAGLGLESYSMAEIRDGRFVLAPPPKAG